MFQKFDLDLLDSFRTDGYATNEVPRNPQYEIPDVVINAPNIRKIKVISIGAGVSGISNAFYIQKYMQNVEHIIYEKNPTLGGTWYENRYPRCGCDIPSHAYSLPFALNPDWPRFYSFAPDIWEYLRKVTEVFDLAKYMNFNTAAVGAYWQEDTAEWLIKLKRTNPDGTVHEFEDRCHLLLYGTGVLNNPKMPDLEGLDKFKGRIVHTARWPKDYDESEWKKDRVVVIGSGASSIQTVPGMQPHVKHMDVFVRTGVWFVPIANNHGQNYEYSQEDKTSFHENAETLIEHAKSIEDQINGGWGQFYKNSEGKALAENFVKERTRGIIKDEHLLQGFTPKFGIGCRRITPGDPYMHAIQEPNVDVHFTPVARVTKDGVVGEDGLERTCDTIVCATGFDTSYRPRFPIIGLRGVNLQDKWAVCPEGYLGLAVPDMPNFLQFIGPSWPVENGSVLGPLMEVSRYMLQMLRKLQSEYVGGLSPRQDVTDAFNEHVQEWVRHTVWTEECRSWYRNNETGRVNAVWPGSSLHYMDAIRHPRWEDYEISYIGPARQNRWAFLGMGFSRDNVEGNFSPYMNLEALEPEWMKATDIRPPPEEDDAANKDEGWAAGAKLGGLCIATAVSILAYSMRRLPR